MKITLNDKLTIIIQWFHSNPLKEKKKNSIYLPFGTKCNILRYEKDNKTDKLDILAIGQSFLQFTIQSTISQLCLKISQFVNSNLLQYIQSNNNLSYALSSFHIFLNSDFTEFI